MDVFESKLNLENFNDSDISILSKYYGLHADNREDLLWLIAISIIVGFQTAQMPPKKRRIEWEKGIGVEQEGIPYPVKKTVYDVPKAEPEARAGLGGIEWPKLKYHRAARTCLQRVMSRYDIWGIEDLEELLDDPEEITKKGIPIMQSKRLQSCLRILKNEANPNDEQLIRQYSMAVGILRKRRRGPPPKIEEDTNSS